MASSSDDENSALQRFATAQSFEEPQPKKTEPHAPAPRPAAGGLSASASSASSSASASSTLPTESTLDEPVFKTLERDVRRVARRMHLVMVPKSDVQDEIKKELRNWDLWGPLVICILLATLLSVSSPADQAATVFCAVFGIVWVGAAVVTLNAQLLEGNISFFQSVCVLGYCVFPMCIAALLCQLAQLLLAGGLVDMLLRAAIALGGSAWSTRASGAFLTDVVPEKRRGLAAYPISMFYLAIAMMVFIQTLTPTSRLAEKAAMAEVAG